MESVLLCPSGSNADSQMTKSSGSKSALEDQWDKRDIGNISQSWCRLLWPIGAPNVSDVSPVSACLCRHYHNTSWTQQEQVSQYLQLTFKGKFHNFQKTLSKCLLRELSMNICSPQLCDYIQTQGGCRPQFCPHHFVNFPQLSALSRRAAERSGAILDCYAFHNNSEINTNNPIQSSPVTHLIVGQVSSSLYKHGEICRRTLLVDPSLGNAVWSKTFNETQNTKNSKNVFAVCHTWYLPWISFSDYSRDSQQTWHFWL